MIQNKIPIAIALSILFFLLSMPMTYVQSDKFLKTWNIRTTFDTKQGLPTTIGIVLHAGFFFLLAMAILIAKENTSQEVSKKPLIEKPESSVPLK